MEESPMRFLLLGALVAVLVSLVPFAQTTGSTKTDAAASAKVRVRDYTMIIAHSVMAPTQRAGDHLLLRLKFGRLT
jgi:hypothetical protein